MGLEVTNGPWAHKGNPLCEWATASHTCPECGHVATVEACVDHNDHTRHPATPVWWAIDVPGLGFSQGRYAPTVDEAKAAAQQAAQSYLEEAKP